MQELLLKVWKQEQCTVIFVTHDVEEAVFLAERICVFKASPGRIFSDRRIPFEQPRKLELKQETRFAEEYKRHLALIGEAMGLVSTKEGPTD
jgi:NitT/TauT family transport system ATP-binding protein